jgi:hypothetical protein
VQDRQHGAVSRPFRNLFECQLVASGPVSASPSPTIDYLAIGWCVIGPRPSTRLHAALEDGVNIVSCADDPSDLIPVREHDVAQFEEHKRIAEAARAHFDRYRERIVRCLLPPNCNPAAWLIVFRGGARDRLIVLKT